MVRTVLLISLILFEASIFSEDIQFYTHILKPFTWEEDNGKVTGLATDIVYEMMDIIGCDKGNLEKT